MAAVPLLPMHADHFPSKPFADPVSWLTFDAYGDLYILRRSERNQPIVKVDPQGRVLASWGKGDVTLPHSIRIDPAGHIWTVDAGSSVVHEYDDHGHSMQCFRVGEMPDNGSPFHGATDIAFAPRGDLFVSDGYGNARVLRYSRDGRRIASWGRLGSNPSEFNLPHALTTDAVGDLYVADRENGRIQEFDPRGRFLRQIEDLGRVYDIALRHDFLWATIGPQDKPPGTAGGWVVKLDLRSGSIVGRLDLPEARTGHALAISPAGEPVVTAGNGLLWFRPDAKR